MSALDILKKSCIPKEFVSFKTLKLGEYKITKFISCDTQQYGRKIRAEFGGQYVYLPKCVADLDDQDITKLNTELPVMMIYSGRSITNNR